MTLRAPLVGWVFTGALMLSLLANAVGYVVLVALVRHFNREVAGVAAKADDTATRCFGPRVLSPRDTIRRMGP